MAPRNAHARVGGSHFHQPPRRQHHLPERRPSLVDLGQLGRGPRQGEQAGGGDEAGAGDLHPNAASNTLPEATSRGGYPKMSATC